MSESTYLPALSGHGGTFLGSSSVGSYSRVYFDDAGELQAVDAVGQTYELPPARPSVLDSYHRDVQGFSAQPELAGGRGPSWWKWALLVAAMAILAGLQGCVSAAAIAQAKDNAAANWGHADDESLPLEARAIAEVNAANWEAQAYNLDGSEISTRAREVLEIGDRP